MNGIASYANQEMVPPGAIANIRGAADMLERFGREGDIYVVHAAEGETVVPMEVLDSSPSLKKMLFSQMEEMGLKPERYVVGNELNSLNPVTGKPEFFFKKLFKSIKGIFKKAAPILGAIVGSFIAPGIGTALGATFGLGATAAGIAGSAIASGIGSFAASKLTGASTKDALKGAAFSAGTAGLFKGFGGLDLAESIPGLDAPFEEFKAFQTDAVGNFFDPVASNPSPTFTFDGRPTLGPLDGDVFKPPLAGNTVNTPVASPGAIQRVELPRVAPSPGTPSPALQTFEATDPRDFGVSLEDLAKAKLPNGGNLTFAQKLAAFPSDAVDFVKTAAQEQLDNNKLGILGGGALAFLNYQEQQEENERIKKAKEDAQKANSLFAQAFRVGSPGINLGQNPDFRPPQRPMLVKKGGEIPSKGLGDIVPAMLEPGEFVMTRNAVAGAGNGSQKNGIKRMYSMMKDFERRV
jgi:hypothetical protein